MIRGFFVTPHYHLGSWYGLVRAGLVWVGLVWFISKQKRLVPLSRYLSLCPYVP